MASKEERQSLIKSGADVKPVYCVPRQGSISSAAEVGLNGNGADLPTMNASSAPAPHGGFLSSLFGGGSRPRGKVRKVPVKVEPKVFFANERTFLAWLNMAVTLASISVAILAFADHNEFSQIYGFIVLPVAICFCLYALFMYVRRSAMLRNRVPGPYEDRIGPVVLTVLLVLSILINMSLKLVDIWTPPSSSSSGGSATSGGVLNHGAARGGGVSPAAAGGRGGRHKAPVPINDIGSD